MKILFKKRFGGWCELLPDEALIMARVLWRGITMGKDDYDQLRLVNRRFAGKKFTIEELKNNG